MRGVSKTRPWKSMRISPLLTARWSSSSYSEYRRHHRALARAPRNERVPRCSAAAARLHSSLQPQRVAASERSNEYCPLQALPDDVPAVLDLGSVVPAGVGLPERAGLFAHAEILGPEC